ncbi:MAG: phosphate ABC transporter permease subunit PstC [Lentimicrobiaceae bacterium]|nr:phosphate ABC transporter permease subunit PstC [Lentimicrobiaceae bacterium]
MRRFFEKTVESIFTISGFVTSIVIVLVVVFLFSGGINLFRSQAVEEGYAAAVNYANPIDKLSPTDLKDIFDYEKTNWEEFGSFDEEILVFRLNDITNYFTDEELGEDFEFVPARISQLIEENRGIIAFIPKEYVSENFNGKEIDGGNITVSDVFTGKEWLPTATPAPLFGLLPLITGTLWVSFIAILIALPFGLSVSIFMSEVANEKLRGVLKPVIELLSGIPSVVYGFFGLVVVVPLVQQVFNLDVGETGLTGSIILAIMALPTIITVSEDAMRNCPRSMREASLSLGANRWQTTYKVVIPYSISGITSGVVLGIGRAIGETMAVLMVTGNSAIIAHSILQPLRTIPATIAAELGEVSAGSPHYQVLFLLGIILFFITLFINTCVEYVSAKNRF